jgi:hypothetical protein
VEHFALPRYVLLFSFQECSPVFDWNVSYMFVFGDSGVKCLPVSPIHFLPHSDKICAVYAIQFLCLIFWFGFCEYASNDCNFNVVYIVNFFPNSVNFL